MTSFQWGYVYVNKIFMILLNINSDLFQTYRLKILNWEFWQNIIQILLLFLRIGPVSNQSEIRKIGSILSIKINVIVDNKLPSSDFFIDRLSSRNGFSLLTIRWVFPSKRPFVFNLGLWNSRIVGCYRSIEYLLAAISKHIPIRCTAILKTVDYLSAIIQFTRSWSSYKIGQTFHIRF